MAPTGSEMRTRDGVLRKGSASDELEISLLYSTPGGFNLRDTETLGKAFTEGKSVPGLFIVLGLPLEGVGLT